MFKEEQQIPEIYQNSRKTIIKASSLWSSLFVFPTAYIRSLLIHTSDRFASNFDSGHSLKKLIRSRGKKGAIQNSDPIGSAVMTFFGHEQTS